MSSAAQLRLCGLLAIVSLIVLLSESWNFVEPIALRAEAWADQQQVAAQKPGLAAGEEHADAKPEEATSSNSWRMIAAVCAAVLVALLPLSGAEAARSGGRMGGMGGGTNRSMRPPPPQAQRQEQVRPGPNISIGVGPMIAPPMYGSPFLAPPMGFFGPPLLIPGPSFGASNADRALQDQQQRDERLLDSQKMQIESMQREIAELKAKRQ